ncbi:ABC transporter substrate-binding protein [Streptomyces montanisoli]|uniref:ABC transporter substrate-binding protein n=1 Tax=Streptomyces montanisoli TaxID=2798581 RepID=A0A940MHK2_9ACTN|nr:ABC transporter substrate-binding protein [Streptomyces montanisoli]MBP0460978.1 ABC transporter substrate-binding protein [Streptomyces montanisoli]
MKSTSNRRAFERRSFLSLVGGASLALAGCAGANRTASAAVPAEALPSGAPPPGTRLAIASRPTQLQLAGSGLAHRLTFTVAQWPNLGAGPDIIQGFRAHSIDLADNAGIPPLQAAAIGVANRIVAVQVRNSPLYEFATAPGSGIANAGDFAGKRIAFSQGQAQGVVVLRALKERGMSVQDVTLVALPSTQFLTALQSRQVDVAPLGEPTLTKYLDQYAKDGARAVRTDVLDLLNVLWAPTDVLADPAKAAAVRDFVPLWAKGAVWAWEHEQAWIDAYYVKDQGVTASDGKRIVSSLGKPVFPASWAKAVAWEEETSELLTAGGFIPKTDAGALFDHRFEHLAAAAVPATYREA